MDIILPLILTAITMLVLMIFAPGLFANKSSDDSNKDPKN